MTEQQIRINDLLYLMTVLDNAIINEIREINRGNGHPAEKIEETLKYWIEERIAFMKRKENNND